MLANNPDLSTDAGQFAIVPEIKKTDKKIEFEFIAAVPREMVSTGVCLVTVDRFLLMRYMACSRM